MVDIKLVIGNPKTGKSFQQEIKDDVSKSFMNLKIGDKVKGELLDYSGYEFQITGGSDKSGFPMRKDIDGIFKKKILAVKGLGLKRKTSKTKKGKLTFKGIRQRKTVAGNTIGVQTSQINLKIIKEGSKKIGPDAQAEAAPAEKAAEEKKE